MKKSNFPKDKTIVCNEKHTPEQHKEIMKMCIDYEVPVFSETWDFNNDPEFEFLIWDGESVFKCNERHKKDYSVSLSEFKAFIRGDGKLDSDKKFTGWKTHSNGWLGYFCKGRLKFGIGFDGRFFNSKNNLKLKECKYERNATTEEVTEALKKEAFKRGFKGNIRVDLTKLGFTNNKILIGDEITWDGEYLDYGTKKTAIFNKGIWAEKINDKYIDMTVSQIEEKLGYKIKIVS